MTDARQLVVVAGCCSVVVASVRKPPKKDREICLCQLHRLANIPAICHHHCTYSIAVQPPQFYYISYFVVLFIMKISALVLLFASASAFVPAARPTANMALSAAAAPAKSKEEDLELTRAVIAKFAGGETAEEPAAPAPEAKEEAPKEKKGKKGN